jgi:hypothetical protein
MHFEANFLNFAFKKEARTGNCQFTKNEIVFICINFRVAISYRKLNNYYMIDYHIFRPVSYIWSLPPEYVENMCRLYLTEFMIE